MRRQEGGRSGVRARTRSVPLLRHWCEHDVDSAADEVDDGSGEEHVTPGTQSLLREEEDDVMKAEEEEGKGNIILYKKSRN